MGCLWVIQSGSHLLVDCMMAAQDQSTGVYVATKVVSADKTGVLG